MTLKVLDLFSGIGGFSHAFDQIERDGKKVFETIAFCEMDIHCKKVLNKHWPDVPVFPDVSKLTKEILGSETGCSTVDGIVGGFPCQDLSTAGKQRGFVDEKSGEATRSGLWFQYKRIIQETKPSWVVIENVPNLLNLGFTTVLQDLHELGYDAEWEIISARSVGSVHLRKRVWIVAYSRSGEWRKRNQGNTTEFRGRASDETEVGTRHSLDAQRPSSRRETLSSGLDANSNSNGESVRNDEQRETFGRNGIQNEGEGVTGNNGENGRVGEVVHSTDSNGIGLEGAKHSRRPTSGGRRPSNESSETLHSPDSGSVGCGQHSRLEETFQSSGNEGLQREEGEQSGLPKSLHGVDEVLSTDSDDFRFWPTFTSEKEKQVWWAEATASVRNWWEVEPTVCRMDDELPDGLHESESFRKQRIKQLGNSIVPGIAKIIGDRIAYHSV